ncbi:MAG: hypothetical protein ACRYF7_23165 [Janthinobacterium lividum]
MTNKNTVKTWRERLGFGSDFPLHAATNVERAMEAEIAELRGCVSQPAALLDENELAALRRFNETCEDGEGYDVPKETMQRLAAIGAVRRTSGSYYELTDFGMCVLEQPAAGSVPNAFLPMPPDRVEQLLLVFGSFEESRWGPENPLQYHSGKLGAEKLVRAVEQEVLARFATLGNCRRCEARGSYAGLVDGKLASVPCADCGGTGKTGAAIQAQQLDIRKECAA